MAVNNDALIEIAISLMNEKNKPQTIYAIAKEAFEIKGIKFNEKSEEYAQFQIDFMLSGDFIACGEMNGEKIWDLKSRVDHEKQDKEGFYIDDPYEDEEVTKNELKDDDYDDDKNYDNSNVVADEDEDESEEKDDIEEDLGYYDDEESDDNESPKKKETFDPEDDVEEDDYDDHDIN